MAWRDECFQVAVAFQALVLGDAWGRSWKQEMEHPQCDQERDNERTNHIISIHAAHGS